MGGACYSGQEYNVKNYNDVWRSDDGRVWTLVTKSAAWAAREGFAVVERRGWIYLMGGVQSEASQVLQSEGVARVLTTRSELCTMPPPPMHALSLHCLHTLYSLHSRHSRHTLHPVHSDSALQRHLALPG
jgi:hypothetical protein